MTTAALSSTPERTDAQRQQQRTTRALLWLCVLGVTHGSLFPWQFHEPWSYRWALRQLFLPRAWWTSNGDVLGNVLLFVPLGVLAWLACEAGRPADRRALLRIVGWSLAFAFVLQVFQIWLPRRSPSISDVLWNGIGLAVGLWLAERSRGIVGWFVEHWHSPHRMGYALALGWLCLAWWPLLPLLARSTVQQTLHQLLLQASVDRPADLLLPGAGLAAIVALLGASRWRWWLAIGLPIVALGGQFFFAQLQPVPGQGMAWMLGALAGMLAWRLAPATRAGAVATLLLAAFVLDGTRPFALADVAQPFHIWPLESSLHEQKVIHTAGLLQHLLRFAVFLTAVRLLRWPAAATTAGLVVLALGLEVLQRWLPGQTADITVALLPLLAAGLVKSLWPDEGPA